jgi:hypothetical protein
MLAFSAPLPMGYARLCVPDRTRPHQLAHHFLYLRSRESMQLAQDRGRAVLDADIEQPAGVEIVDAHKVVARGDTFWELWDRFWYRT